MFSTYWLSLSGCHIRKVSLPAWFPYSTNGDEYVELTTSIKRLKLLNSQGKHLKIPFCCVHSNLAPMCMTTTCSVTIKWTCTQPQMAPNRSERHQTARELCAHGDQYRTALSGTVSVSRYKNRRHFFTELLINYFTIWSPCNFAFTNCKSCLYFRFVHTFAVTVLVHYLSDKVLLVPIPKVSKQNKNSMVIN
jgi:hypothetical protein